MSWVEQRGASSFAEVAPRYFGSKYRIYFELAMDGSPRHPGARMHAAFAEMIIDVVLGHPSTITFLNTLNTEFALPDDSWLLEDRALLKQVGLDHL